MAPAFEPGMEVTTSKFGSGTIHEIKPDGAVVLLPALRLMVKVPFAELQLVTGAQRPDKEEPKTSAAEPDRGLAVFIRSVEALRFGIVPHDSVGRLTVGYESLRKWVLERLPDNNGQSQVSEVCGHFGTGKSHTMAAIRQIAAEEQYLTAHVEVNGKDVTLADPGRLLYHLWATIAAAEVRSATPLIEANLRASERGYTHTQRRIQAFDRVTANFETVVALREFGHLDHFEHLLEDLMASNDSFPATDIRRMILSEFSTPELKVRIDPKRMVGIPVDERPDDFANCLLGYAALASRAGFKGLVVTLDEFEVEYKAFGFSYIQPRVVDLLQVLGRRLSKADPKSGAPLALFIATVGQQGEEGDTHVRRLLDETGGEARTLRKWSSRELQQLARKIHDLYCEAYSRPEAFDDALAKQVEKRIEVSDADLAGHVRAFIKAYVAELDLQYGPPRA